MAFIDDRIPECVSEGFASGQNWNTQLVPLDNGREQRNGQWLYPKVKLEAQYKNFSLADKDSVLQIAGAARGMLHCFRVKDWADHTATDEVIVPEAGTTTAVQLTKTYTFGSQSAVRLIQAPVDGTVTVYRNGVAVAGTLDATTGLFTPDANWAATGTFTWSGEFDVWMRFDTDYIAFTAAHMNAWSADFSLIEVRR
jgi:uncharacterized protein (TIGR02217 family)